MKLTDVQPIKFSFGRMIRHNGKIYKEVPTSRIGDIILCLGRCHWTTKGEYYKVVECYPPDGFKGIIGDDNEPMGLHDRLGGYKIFRETRNSLFNI